MSYSISEINGVKIYNMSAGKTFPQFLEEARKKNKSLRYDQEFRNRIELIQEFDFPIASGQVTITPDEKYIIASGIYPPRIKVYDTHDLTIKFERGIDSEVIKFCTLAEDYSKLAFACVDRNIEFHTQQGNHYKTRIPKPPRDMVFNPFTCDLLISASSDQIYRMSLDEGVFLQSLQSECQEGINTLEYNQQLNLLISGGNNGIVEIWDYRMREKIKTSKLNNGEEITSIKFDDNGLLFAVGSAKGLVRILDIRQNEFISELKHHYKSPINTIKFHQKSRCVVTSNNRSIKINNKDTCKLFTTIEPTSQINQFDISSGLLLVAQDQPRIGIYFIPDLDNAPKWCNFLENVTEELEQDLSNKIYDEFKFLSIDDLEALNSTNLIGTKLLKSHMHGYLMHNKLYQKLSAKSEIFAYQEYKQKLIDEQFQQETQKLSQKVSQNQQSFKFNQEYIDELIKKTKNKNFSAQKLIEDDRFKQLFNKAEFKIDKTSDEYLLHHGSNRQNQINRAEDYEEVQGDQEKNEKSKFDLKLEKKDKLIQKSKKIKKQQINNQNNMTFEQRNQQKNAKNKVYKVNQKRGFI